MDHLRHVPEYNKQIHICMTSLCIGFLIVLLWFPLVFFVRRIFRMFMSDERWSSCCKLHTAVGWRDKQTQRYNVPMVVNYFGFVFPSPTSLLRRNACVFCLFLFYFIYSGVYIILFYLCYFVFHFSLFQCIGVAGACIFFICCGMALYCCLPGTT